MISIADLLADIANYLITTVHASGINSGSWPAFLDAKPVTPDSVICLFEYSGEPSTIQDDLSRRVQVLVRSASYDVSKAKIWNIFKSLNNPEDRTITVGNRKGWFRALQQPFKFETDENKRTVFIFNLEVIISPD